MLVAQGIILSQLTTHTHTHTHTYARARLPSYALLPCLIVFNARVYAKIDELEMRVGDLERLSQAETPGQGGAQESRRGSQVRRNSLMSSMLAAGGGDDKEGKSA